MEQLQSIIVKLPGIVSSIFAIASCLIAAYAFMYKTKSKLMELIITMIKTLQADDKLSGPDKMMYVINYVRNFVPRAFRVIFNDKVLEDIAQNIYDDMKKYADNKAQTKLGMSFNQAAKVIEQSTKEEPVQNTKEKELDIDDNSLNLQWIKK